MVISLSSSDFSLSPFSLWTKGFSDSRAYDCDFNCIVTFQLMFCSKSIMADFTCIFKLNRKESDLSAYSLVLWIKARFENQVFLLFWTCFGVMESLWELFWSGLSCSKFFLSSSLLTRVTSGIFVTLLVFRDKNKHFIDILNIQKGKEKIFHVFETKRN